MDMHLEYLESFLTLAQGPSFTAAARTLGISQSSLTKRIHNLEDSIGMRLFDRSVTGVSLTPVGKLYLKYANQIDDLQDRFGDELSREFKQSGTLTFGVIPSASEYGLTRIISRFMRSSGCRCSLTTARSEDLELMLGDGLCDFAFIKNESGTNDFRRILVTNDHMVFVASVDHPLAQHRTVSLGQLKDESFFFEPKGSRPYLTCVELCRKAGFEPNIVGTDGQMDNIVDFAAQGLAVSLLMSGIVPHDRRIVAIPLDPPVVSRIDLCFRNRPLSAMQRRFLDFFETLSDDKRSGDVIVRREQRGDDGTAAD
ncbi:LysR family transcriptional regulator [Bifidobacterium choloepi]|nr:LysR family transcriptional regulator [Bifidobacterium choloepi]